MTKEPLWGKSTIYGRDGEHKTPYMTRYWFGRLRLHVFYRGDADPDCHDHPWGFWTLPLTSYVEEVVDPTMTVHVANREGVSISKVWPTDTFSRVVRAFRLHYRPATHTHRVLGRYDGTYYVVNNGGIEDIIAGYPPEKNDGKQRLPMYRSSQKITTIVWRGKGERKWGFLKARDGRWCWTPWKEYIYGGGKSAPCE